MKIAIVTSFPPSKVTLSEYGYHLVKHFALKDEIDEIVLITDHTSAPKQLDFSKNNCIINVQECWRFNSYKSIVGILQTIYNEKPDAVLFNLQFMTFGDKKIPAALGLLLPFLLKLARIPNIVLLHNILELVDLENAGITNNKFLKAIYNFIGSLLTRFILESDIVAVTISKYVDILKEKYRKDNIVLIPHGAFELPPKAQFDLPKGPKKVMSFGKFGTYKKVEIMIEAVQGLRKKTNEEIEIVIAGTDSPNTPGYLDSVQKKYANVPNLTFTGYVEEKDVPVIFGESAVVVFPYTSTTGSSGVLHQAGSYGKAVVLPDIGDLSILVKEEGYRGEFFNPNEINSLSNAIQKIITNDTYRKELGILNYKAACSLPMTIIADMYLTYFDAICANNLGEFLVRYV
jgi:glycosyltransferase involved in cell wall biosynthesis